MSAMLRVRTLFPAVILSLVILRSLGNAQTDDRDQRLHDQYFGKTFLLRGSYSNVRLKYDASGAPVRRTNSGDWTTDGLVLVNDIQVKGRKLQITARRLNVDSLDKVLQLQPAETRKPGEDPKPLMVEIESDLGQPNPSAEQAEAALAKIFLTVQDDFTSLVPDYWKPCLAGEPTGKPICRFSPELLVVPGFSRSNAANSEATTSSGAPTGLAHPPIYHVGDGMSPPRVLFSPDPEFSERARQAKFQGAVVLDLVVNPDGLPTDIHIVNPLGSGLDAKAVQAVKTWKFKPAEKDGLPVPAEIQVEVDFRLY